MSEDPENLDEEVIRSFWARKAEQASNRWTSQEMMSFELDLVGPLAREGSSILDLGSGHGELSRGISGEGNRLVAVDWEQRFASSFTSDGQMFVHSRVNEFEAIESFDLVLLFGVVTCLPLAAEIKTYSIAASALAKSGTLVVKNQCAHEEEFAVNLFSQALGERYSARYPAFQSQLDRLSDLFGQVDVIKYPQQFNQWENTYHVAFVCKL